MVQTSPKDRWGVQELRKAKKGRELKVSRRERQQLGDGSERAVSVDDSTISFPTAQDEVLIPESSFSRRFYLPVVPLIRLPYLNSTIVLVDFSSNFGGSPFSA